MSTCGYPDCWVLSHSVVGIICTSHTTDMILESIETIISPTIVYCRYILLCTPYILMFSCTVSLFFFPILFHSNVKFPFVSCGILLLFLLQAIFYSLLSVHNVSTMKSSNIYGHCVHSMKSCRSIHISFIHSFWCEAIDISVILKRSCLPGRSHLLCAVFHDNDGLSHPPPLSRLADGCRADVRCRARGGRGCAAVSADHCQLITVQPTQALALREPLHGPHQRGRCFSTFSPSCLPLQHTQHLHTENTCSQASRGKQNVNKAEAVKKKGKWINRNDLSMYLFIWKSFFQFVYIHTPQGPLPSWACSLNFHIYHPCRNKNTLFDNCPTVWCICEAVMVNPELSFCGKAGD